MNEMRVNCMSDNMCNQAQESKNIPPLSALMDEITCMAGDALNKVYRVNQHLFGLVEPKVGELPEIKCFQDVVLRQAVSLKELNEALEILMKKVGV